MVRFVPPKGFSAVKRAVIDALRSGRYLHEARGDIDAKNLLLTGVVSAAEIARVIAGANGREHRVSPHHSVRHIEVHVIKSQGWYVKFYFLDDGTWFISVHK